MKDKIKVTTFYKFHRTEKTALQAVTDRLTFFGENSDLKGLIIVATEGINGTVAASPAVIDELQTLLPTLFDDSKFLFKNSWANSNPFRRYKVKTRDEIVTFGKPGFAPNKTKNNHLTPSEWNKILNEEDVIVLDTRNWYETEIGVFEKAVDPKISTFQQFVEYLDNVPLPKDKRILMYCTGGIRCEKAMLEMQERGYENAYQLEGGILKYLEEFPDGHFKGECFVFDHRVAVDSNLEPSRKFHLCCQCGDPGDERVTCQVCGKEGQVCKKCASTTAGKTCSKNCAYHAVRLTA